MAFEYHQPREQDLPEPGNFRLGDAGTRPILYAIAVVLLLSYALSTYGLSGWSHAGDGQSAAAASAPDRASAEATPYFPGQFVNRATAIEPYVEPF